jgi:hypothetical protein
MLLSESAVETLERNSPSGLLEAIFVGASFSTSARSFFAAAESPDLRSDIRLENALSKVFLLLLEELEVDDVASSVRRLEVLCRLEISMKVNPFHIDFSENHLPKAEVLRANYEDCVSVHD